MRLRCAALRCTAASVSCSPAGVQLPPVCAVCVLRHATSFCDCVSGGLRRNAGWWRRVAAESRDPEKSISAEYLMELEPRRFEPPARLQSGRWVGVCGGGGDLSEGFGTTAALFPMEATRCLFVSAHCDPADPEMKRRTSARIEAQARMENSRRTWSEPMLPHHHYYYFFAASPSDSKIKSQRTPF